MAGRKLLIITGTSLSVGDLLRWDGSNWVNYADSAYAGGGGGYNPVPVCTSYGTEKITAGGSGSVTGSNQVCDWVWVETFNASNAPYLLIAPSGPADTNDFWMPYRTVLGPYAVSNTNELHFYFMASGHTVHILWGAE